MTETLARPTTGTERSEGSHRPRLGWVLVLTSAAFFMTCLDSLVVGTALPRIQESLHVGFASLQWTVNSYNIAVAAGIICAAALGDRYGRRRFFVLGLTLFTVASAACAVAPTAALLPSGGDGRGCTRAPRRARGLRSINPRGQRSGRRQRKPIARAATSVVA